MRQAAMYVRVSTQQQRDDATIESQKAALLKFANEKGFEIPLGWVFEDNGISGAILARPALDRLRDYAAERLFDCVFVLSPDRLSRKCAYQVILIEEFSKNGVDVLFKNSPNSNTPEDGLLVQMQGMFAEYERAQIAERSRRGKLHKAKNGSVSVLGRAPYGYRYIKGVDGQQAYFEIADREASVVKIIFDLCVNKRLSMSKICDNLASRKIPSPKGHSEWCTGTIGKILHNSSYRGMAYFGMRESCQVDPMRMPSRQVRIKERVTPPKGSRMRDASKWIGIPVPSIINNDLFELAQEILDRNKILSIRSTKEGSLLQGLISCKECGYAFKKITSGPKSQGYNYYRCGKRGGCENRGLRVEQLDQTIWNELISILEEPELLENEVSRRLSEAKKEPVRQRQKQLERKLSKLNNESDRMLDAYQEDCIGLPELKSRISAIKREVNNIKREMAEIDAGLSESQLMELTAAINHFSDLVKAARTELPLFEKRKILRMLIKEIQIGKDDITINHIIPTEKQPLTQIARLYSHHVRALRVQ